MTIEKFRDLWQAMPFRPFEIHLADGRSISVRHREFLAMSPSGRTAIVYQPDDSHNIIDLLLVTNFGSEGQRPSQVSQAAESRLKATFFDPYFWPESQCQLS